MKSMDLTALNEAAKTHRHVCAVIGDPIAHSISPLIHNTLFDRYDFPGILLPVRVGPEDVAALFAAAKEIPLRGLSVTMPLKQAVIPFCDTVEDAALQAQSVNCVTFSPEEIRGTSTDARGLELALAKDGISYDGCDILVFGSGAVSLPILISMATHCRSITITNRTPEKAQKNAAHLRTHFSCDVRVIPFETSAIRAAVADSQLIVNTTSLGMQGTEHDFQDLSFLDAAPSDAYVCDLIYRPAQTAFLKAASARGLRTQNGLNMLICQAFEIFYRFTGIRPAEEDAALLRAEVNHMLLE